MTDKHIVFVFANLKPSQINYKILPLVNSDRVEKVVILRKTPMEVDHPKVSCIALPSLFTIKILYLLFTPWYGIWMIKKYGATLILSYNIFPHGFNGYFASLFTGKPLIYAEIVEDTMRFYSNWWKGGIIKRVLNRSSRILVPGSVTGNFWESKGYHKTFQLHSTVNPDYFKVDPSIEKKYDFIYIGVLDDRKRPDMIISNLKKMAQSRIQPSLCIIGYGELKESLHAMVEELGLTEFVTFKETNDVLLSLRESKIMVMASLAEGIPCAMMEAMACELVVVVPPVGDISDVILHGENGFLHDNSLADLFDKMEEAYTRYHELGAMRQQARETILKAHSYQTATSKWNTVLKDV